MQRARVLFATAAVLALCANVMAGATTASANAHTAVQPTFSGPANYSTNDADRAQAVTTTTYNDVQYVLAVNRGDGTLSEFPVNANGSLGTVTNYPIGIGPAQSYGSCFFAV